MKDFELQRLELINQLKDQLPPICTTRNLIDVGLYKSHTLAANARREGLGPKAVYIAKRGYVYERDEVIEYILENEKKKSIQLVKRTASSPITWTEILKKFATAKCKGRAGP